MSYCSYNKEPPKISFVMISDPYIACFGCSRAEATAAFENIRRQVGSSCQGFKLMGL